MSVSNDPGHYFQTSAVIAESERKGVKSKNKHGNPIKLGSKILACAVDPSHDGRIYVAEAGGVVKHLDIDSGAVLTTYAGPAAPITSVAVAAGALLAGCWDKNIYHWPLAPHATQARRQKPRTILRAAHADFVKALLPARLGDAVIVVSAGADAAIRVWAAESGARLHSLTGHSRAVLALALDAAECGPDAVVFFSADGGREIRRWRVTAASACEVPMAGGTAADGARVAPLVVHETSVYALWVDAGGDLWTASADGTAKCLVRERGWAVDVTLRHPDFVRDVVVDEKGRWVVTACRDEEVRVWHRASGTLFHTFSGHFEEVTGLLLLGSRLVSVGIDATVRSWSLAPHDLIKAKEAAAQAGGSDGDDDSGRGVEQKTSLLTDDEEREIAELMGDDDDD